MNLHRALLGTAAIAVLGLGGCASHPSDAPIISGPPPTENYSPLADGLSCVADMVRQDPTPITIAVGRVADLTGKYDIDDGGYRVTQGANLMVMTALSRVGVRQVERTDVVISETEASMATRNLLRDENQVRTAPTAGQYPGSDYYIVGGITEVNNNLETRGGEISVNGAGAGYRVYKMNIAVDLRLVNTRTLETVKIVSIRKTIVGREIRIGTFQFFQSTLVNAEGGDKSQEPIGLGVRTVLERATGELIFAAHRADFTSCRSRLEAPFVIQ